MKTTLATTAAALLAMMLVGTAMEAQQTTAAAQTSSSDGAAPEAISQPSSELANSKVRIVRLSEVKGAVELDRNTGRGFESAMANLPIVEGARLRSDTGFAEVEFEDNSTLRIAPNTVVEFPQLELRPSGAKVSTVNVLQGTVYANLASTKGNDFTLTFGPEKIALPPSSHIRLQMEPAQAKLAVLDGAVQVQEPSGTTMVGKKKTLTFDLAKQSEPTMAKNVAEDQNDAWDHDAVEYQKRYTNGSAFANSPYAYGISDMNYYGSFLNAGGCGSMWRPYFASAGWDPFGNGVWAWYQGAGYSWVSPYPWGWMPFHYGSWNFCSGVGWGWQPGGSWMGLANTQFPIGQQGKPFQPPHPPVRAPLAGQSTLMPVNLRPLAVSNLGAHDTFVFRNDSAGMGVPRGSLGELRQFSSGVQHHGSVATPVYFETPQTGRMANGAPASSLRQGSAVRAESESYSHYSGSAASAQSSSSGAMANRGAGGGPASSGASAASGSGRR
jgi:FecR protein